MRSGKSEAAVTMSQRKMYSNRLTCYWSVGLVVKRRLLCSLWGNEEGEERGRCNHVQEEDVLYYPAAGLMVKKRLLCSLWGNEEGEE
jgi:hypothetical protein